MNEARLIGFGVLGVVLGACSSGPDGTVINVYKYEENAFDEVVSRCNQEAGGRYTIVMNSLPRDADGQREQLVRRMAAGDESVDVMGLDVTWTAEFAEAGWILEWTGADRLAAIADQLPGPLATATWEGRIHAVPANTNVQLLWYRKDLVPEPPTTWDEMLAIAAELGAAGKPHAIAFTGARYEGLVVGFNTILASYGGSLVDADGVEATIDERTVQALALLKRFATSVGASESLSNSRETEVQAEMENGYAAFELNWPYVYAAMRANRPELFPHFGFAPYPSVVPGEPASVTTGGLNYAVSAYSRHSAEAREAALCLRSIESQKHLALNAGIPPTFASLYDDPELRAAYPMADVIRDQLRNAVPRPRTPFYQNVSAIVAAALSPPDEIEPEATARELRRRVQDALESTAILP
jgi:multiple sugar transport system substrate-binding protein